MKRFAIALCAAIPLTLSSQQARQPFDVAEATIPMADISPTVFAVAVTTSRWNSPASLFPDLLSR